ncbi:MAG TPA: SPOR domain-containing protein [Acetobacteraceae bacterium]|nr:SPOR domain-containing protein [Acetobacteraceae bacterium]
MRDDLEIPAPGYRVARRSGGLDPATRRLATIAAGIGGALVVLVGIWSMVGGGSTGIPTVSAPSGAMREKPANPGGMQVTGTNESILGGGDSSGQPALAPPPETPDLQALQSPPAAKPASVPTEVTEDGESVPPAGAALGPNGTNISGTNTVAPSAPASANGLPLPPPSPPPIQLASVSATPPPPAAIGTGTGTEVQFAALSSEENAISEWGKLQAALPDLLDGRQPLVSKVELDGHVFWRLRTGGFENIAQATSFCASVRAKGMACDIAAF